MKKRRYPISEAEIQRRIALDPDNPESTPEELAQFRPFREVLPDLAAAMDREIARRGRPKLEHPKEAITLRLAPSTIAKFKAAGGDWRARMTKALERAKG